MTVLGIVPARSGSKGVPGKNLRQLGGKSLIAHAAAVGLASACDHVILTTDSEDYAAEGRRAGLDVPCLRPAELAVDATPMMDVVRHIVTVFEKLMGPVSTLVLLQPTSPFRRAEDINACLERLEQKKADSVVSVVPVPTHHNAWHQLTDTEGHLDFVVNRGYAVTRRQDMPTCYVRNGAIYVLRRELIDREPPTFFGDTCVRYDMPVEDAVNIDEEADFLAAERHWTTWSA